MTSVLAEGESTLAERVMRARVGEKKKILWLFFFLKENISLWIWSHTCAFLSKSLKMFYVLCMKKDTSLVLLGTRITWNMIFLLTCHLAHITTTLRGTSSWLWLVRRTGMFALFRVQSVLPKWKRKSSKYPDFPFCAFCRRGRGDGDHLWPGSKMAEAAKTSEQPLWHWDVHQQAEEGETRPQIYVQHRHVCLHFSSLLETWHSLTYLQTDKI